MAALGLPSNRLGEEAQSPHLLEHWLLSMSLSVIAPLQTHPLSKFLTLHQGAMLWKRNLSCLRKLLLF